MKTDLSICTLFKHLPKIYLNIMRMKFVNKCEFLKNATRSVQSLVAFQYHLDSLFGLCALSFV
jgi:hypothetical protein